LEVQLGKICFVFHFILHTAYTVDACALTSRLPPCLWWIWHIERWTQKRCRGRFLDWYGFRIYTTLWNVFVIDLRDSVVFSVVQTVMKFERIWWVMLG